MDRPAFRMLPEVTDESSAFWTGGAQGELRIHRCRSCQHWFHPPVSACFRCRSREVGAEPASGRARLAAFTINQHPWFEGFPPPYVIGIVELEEESDVRLTTNVIDCAPDDLWIGMPLEVVFEEREDVWLPLFRPVSA